MKSKNSKRQISFTKLLYSLIFAFFVLFQGIRFSNVDTVYVSEVFLTKDMLLGYLTILLAIPFLVIFFLFIPVVLVVEVSVLFDMNIRVKTRYQTYIKPFKNRMNRNIKQSSLGVFRC